MSFTSRLRNFFKDWLPDTKRKPERKRRLKRHLVVEMLEDRTLLASTTGLLSNLPIPVASNQTSLGSTLPGMGGAGQEAGGLDPQVAVDPMNPQKIVVVADNGNALVAYYSIDGGQNWTNFMNEAGGDFTNPKQLGYQNPYPNLSDPVQNPANANNMYPMPKNVVTFSVVSPPSVAFDKTESFYIVAAESSADETSGALVLNKFDFSGSNVPLVTPFNLNGGFQPSQSNQVASMPTIANEVLYAWNNTDQVYNPFVGVDNNVSSYTDPQTKVIQADTLADLIPDPNQNTIVNPSGLVPKGVYVAWNTQAGAIETIVSSDGGADWTNPTIIAAKNGSDPQIVFAQGNNKTTAADFDYEGVAAPALNLTSATTAAQVFANLSAIPALTGNITVTGGTGGPFTVTFNNNTFNQELFTTNPQFQLGNNSFITYSFMANTATIANPGVPSGQLIFEWDVIGGGIDMALSQPTGGVDANPAAVADTYTYQGFPGNISGPLQSAAPFTPALTPFTFDVTSANLDPNMSVLDTVTVGLSIIAPEMGDLEIVLSSPGNLVSVPLFTNAINPVTGNAFNPLPNTALPTGLVNMGMINVSPNGLDGYSLFNSPTDGPFVAPEVGTVFDDTATTNITAGAEPFVGHFKPAGKNTSLDQAFAGLTRSQMLGTWTLTIINNAALVSGKNYELVGASLNLTGATAGDFQPGSKTPFGATLQLPLFGAPTFVAGQPWGPAPYEILQGAFNNTYNFPSASSPSGIGPGVAIAVDNTLGSFSPYQGQIYVAYTGVGLGENVNGGIPDDTDIFLLVSNDDGQTWNNTPDSTGPGGGPGGFSDAGIRVNDDTATDGFSQGNRVQFDPALAVDPSSGNVVVTYFDGRYDPSRIRLADSLSVSNDGGQTFTQSIFLNTPSTATNAITGQSVTVEPIPGNPSVPGSLVEPNGGFGDRQTLAVVNGHVYPIYTTNLNSLDLTDANPNPGGTRLSANLWTASVTIPDGPRIISSDMGPILEDGSTGSYNSTQTAGIYDNTFTSDGTRQFTGFTVTFDQAVDPATFTPSQVTLMYQSPTALTGAYVNLSNQVTSVIPLNMEDSPGVLTTPTLSVGDAILPRPVLGSVANMLFPVVLSQPQMNPVTLAYTVAGDNAVAGTDFSANTDLATLTAPSGAVTFRYNGAVTTSFVYDSTTTTAGDIQAVLDTIPALAGSVSVTGANGLFSILFENNLNPALLSAGSTDPITLALAYSGSVVIPAGQTGANIAVPIIGNSTVLADQTVTLSISAPLSFTVNRPTATGTIINPTAGTPTVSIGDAILNKGFYGTHNAEIPIVLSAPASGTISVQYATSDGTATTVAGEYTATSGKVTFAAGQSTAYIIVPVMGNSSVTGDLNFTVDLSKPIGATLDKSSGTVTIVDDSGLLGATEFQINVRPQSAVGSYSYSISPFVSNRIRSVAPTITDPFTGNPALINPNPAAGGVVVTASAPPSQVNLTIPSIDSTSGTGGLAESTLTLGGVPLGQVVRELTVTVTLDHPVPQDIVMTLIGPNGTSVDLTELPSSSSTFGIQQGLGASPNGVGNYLDTTFDSAVRQQIITGNAPFTGQYQPVQSLDAFIGTDPNANGTNSTWTLEIENEDPGNPNSTPARLPTAATLISWSITVQTGAPVDINTDVITLTAGTGSATLTYNGNTATPPTFNFLPTTTPGQLQAYLSTLPGLTAPNAVTVSSPNSSSANQYASYVMGFSSQYSTTAWSAQQALGPPDTPAYGDFDTAWAPLPENGTQEFLTLGYATPIYATAVDVRETDGNGFVTQIDLVDTNGVDHTVFSGPDSTQPGTPGDLIVNFAPTNYLVQGVKIYVNTNHNLGTWEEIDSVQLQGSTGISTATQAGPFVVTFAPGLNPNSLTVVSGAAQLSAPGSSSGNYMDQAGNAIPGDMLDTGSIYSVPTPTDGIPFTLPYNQATLPLVIPGPHVVDMTYAASPIFVTFTATSGPISLAYNGISPASPFSYAATNSTPAALQSYLSTIPALSGSGSVEVTGNLQGPFTITLASGFNPSLLTIVSGPISFTRSGADTLSFTASSGKVTLAYGGVSSTAPLAFDMATTTANMIQTYLGTVPGLSALGGAAVTGSMGGPFTITFNGGADASLLTVTSGPAQLSRNVGQVNLPIPDATLANSTDDIVFTANSGSVTFDYNGIDGTPFSFAVGTTTAAQLLANLSAIPGLIAPGSVRVSPAAGGAFLIGFGNGQNPDLLTVTSGPATITTTTTTTPGVLNSTIDVAGVAAGQVISNLTVTVDISHPLLTDLQLALIAPDGTRVPLSSNTLTAGATTFADTGLNVSTSATTTTVLGVGPDIAPASPLSALIGKSPNGVWTLQIEDTVPGNSGFLTGWSMAVATNEDLNAPSSSVVVTFDRDIQPGSFTPANILNFMGPTGTIVPPTKITFTASGSVTLAYKSAAAPTALAYSATTTAAQLQAYLETIPGLTAAGSVTVTGGANGIFTVTWGTDLNPTQLNVVSGPAKITTYTITADPAGTPVGLANRTFAISGFTAQSVGGSYAMTFGPDAYGNYIKDDAGNEEDTNFSAGVAVLFGGEPSNGTPQPVINTSNLANSTLPLPPEKTVVSTITVPNDFLIQGVTVTLNIQHAHDPDLTATLIGPNGASVQLFSGVGTSGTLPHANFTNATFCDSATVPIQLATTQGNGLGIDGTFNPQFPLSAFKDLGSSGTWTLVINSTSSAITGTLTNWTLTLFNAVAGSGLGETVADQFTSHFNVFIQDPTTAASQANWTPVGPASINEVDPTTGALVTPSDAAGPVAAIAVDPSDPSGNTVFVGGASGGIWKTTDFLTTNPNGPSYLPLTNTGPGNSLNISSIAVAGRNNDPNQSVIFAATGNGGENLPGVGVLRSTDGGQTWTLLDSATNVNASGTPLAFNDPTRLHDFVGLPSFKILVDPTPESNGNYYVYVAFASTSTQTGGVWRSADSGNTWTEIMAGDATDLAFALDSQSSTGNLQILYAGFRNSAVTPGGVYFTSNATGAAALSLLGGGQGVPLRRDMDGVPGDDPVNSEIPVEAPPSTPNGANGRIALATPALTGNPLQDTLYEGWLFAMVSTASTDGNPADGGSLQGLYMTKDFGLNWTQVQLPFNVKLGEVTNDPTQGNYNPLGVTGNENMSLVVSPDNPNIVYVGGDIGIDGDSQYSTLLRVDVTQLNDAYAMVAYDNHAKDGGLTQWATTGAVSTLPYSNVDVAAFIEGPSNPYGLDSAGILNLPQFGGPAPRGPYYDLERDPSNPFLTPSTLGFANIQQFNNTGDGAVYTAFDLTGIIGDSQAMLTSVAIKDPTTGQARLLFGDLQGIWTGVDTGDGTLSTGVGSNSAITGQRNGNLQLEQMTDGAVQPSTLAEQIAGALLYGSSVFTGSPVSNPNILANGNLAWNEAGYTSASAATGAAAAYHLANTESTGVAVDQTGTGQSYQFVTPDTASILQPFTYTDFFLVTPPGDTSPTSRTTGLLQAGDNPKGGTGQWPAGLLFPIQSEDYALTFGRFAVNPLDPSAIVISSEAGRIFETSGPSTGTGIQWFPIANPTDLDGSYADALAFGSPATTSANPDNFIYAGTLNGNVFVTLTGGGVGTPWTNLGSPDGSPIMEIAADPTPGTHDAYVVTLNGVYYMPNSSILGTPFVNITGNLFSTSLAREIFDVPSQTENTLKFLTSIAPDWRYAIPGNIGTVTGTPTTHPVLYVAGSGGVFRSLNNGGSWTYYPDIADDGAAQQGGLLPGSVVTQLSIAGGDLNPANGSANPANGYNVLVASTYGSGDYAIRLDDSVLVGTTPLSKYAVNPVEGPHVNSIATDASAQGLSMTGITVTFNSAVDPETFTPAKIDSLTGPGGTKIAVANVLDITPASANVPHSIFEIVFAQPQTTSGTYSVTLGPDISDYAGNEMDQNQNGINGEVPADEFTGTTHFTANVAPVISYSRVVAANPVVTAIPTQLGVPGQAITVPFYVFSATQSPLSALQLIPSPTSSNTTLVPDANVVASAVASDATGSERLLTITPASGTSGITFITINVVDALGLAGTPVTFEVIFDSPPVAPTVPSPQTVVHGKTFQYANYVTTSPDTPPLPLTTTISAVTISPIYNLWTELKFFEAVNPATNLPSYFQDSAGLNEKWVMSQTNGNWYIIQPSGTLSEEVSAGKFTPVLVDQYGNALNLDNSYWQDPTKLTNPAAPISLQANLVGTTLTIAAPEAYVGSVAVAVNTTDGVYTTTRNFTLNVTNVPPSFSTIPNQVISPATNSITLNLATQYSLTDPDDGLAGVTLDTSKAYAYNSASIAYMLDQTYNLYFTGNAYQNSAGLNEKWVRGLTTGTWYIIQPNGNFSLSNGGTSFTLLATLDPSYWQNLSALVQAPQPPALAGQVAVNDANHTVTITPNQAEEMIEVSAFDGQATTSKFFTLTQSTTAPTFTVTDQQFDHAAAGNPQLVMDLTAAPFNLLDHNGESLTTSLSVYNYAPAEAYYLSTTDNLQFNTSYYQDSSGLGERWLYGQATGKWYIIQPNGNFSQWNGAKSFTTLATLNSSYWSNPNLLINQGLTAPTPLVGPISSGTAGTADNSLTIGVNGNTISFETNGQSAGSYLVSVTNADANSSTTHSFKLSVTDQAPTFTMPTTAASIAHTSSYDTSISNIADADDGQAAVTMSANVYPYVAGFAYELQQAYAFYTTGNYYSTGSNPKWFRSAVNNSWYTINQSGAVSLWNGGNNFTSVGTLDGSYYLDPTKLFNAQAPTPLNPGSIATTFTGTNATGYDLNLAPGTAGGNLLVQVNASDGVDTTSQYFELTVTSPTPSFTVTPQNPVIAYFSPALATISNISAGTDPVTAVNFTAAVYNLIPGLAYQLDLAHDFSVNGGYYQNVAGMNEKWLYSQPEKTWYIIAPNGALSVWNGGSSFTPVMIDGMPAVLSAAYWSNPSLLINAALTPPPDLSQPANGTFTTSFSGANATGLTLTVNGNNVNQGNFLIEVTGSDSGNPFNQFYAQTFSDFAPTFGQPADQSSVPTFGSQPGTGISHQVHTFTLDLTNPASYSTLNYSLVDPDPINGSLPSPVLTYAEGSLSNVTLSVKAYYNNAASTMYQLDTELQFFSTGNYYYNSAGMNERWFKSAVNNLWYIISPAGTISLWNGGSSFTPVAQVSSSYYGDLAPGGNASAFFNAPEPVSADQGQAPAVTGYSVDNVNDTVTVNTSPNFIGDLLVKVTATSPTGLSTTQFFKLSMIGLAPTLDSIANQSLSKSGTPLTLELVGNDPDSGNTQPLTYNLSITNLSAAAQAYAFQSQYGLYESPPGNLWYNYYGHQEIWLRSSKNQAWFGIGPDGSVYALAAAPNPYASLGSPIFVLNANYYNNPMLVFQATQPAPLPLTISTPVSAGDVNNPLADDVTLQWTNPAMTGTFLVTATATNALGVTTTETFTVVVS